MKINWPDLMLPPINIWSARWVGRSYTIRSPCINTCKVKDGICIGCNRTLEEIKDYGNKHRKSK